MDWTDWARTLLALIATLAMIGLAAYAARRFGMMQANAGAATRRLKVIESLMLDPRRRLLVVRFDQREHLLLLTPTGDLKLDEVSATELGAEVRL